MVCAKILKKYCVLHKLEKWNRNCLYKIEFLQFAWFSGEAMVWSHHHSTKWTFVFLRVCLVSSSHSA